MLGISGFSLPWKRKTILLRLLQTPLYGEAGDCIRWSVGCMLLTLSGICTLKMGCNIETGKPSVRLQCWCTEICAAWEYTSAVIGLALLAQVPGLHLMDGTTSLCSLDRMDRFTSACQSPALQRNMIPA